MRRERWPLMRRRQNERKATRLARVLVSLDDAARENRPWRPRRAQLAALSAAGARRPL
jgi:hypothetical protein